MFGQYQYVVVVGVAAVLIWLAWGRNSSADGGGGFDSGDGGGGDGGGD